ncbi:MAG: hypothetical protein PHO31_00925 [Candidatus Pacebacteria bacterium]|nr:hypothetical protein [Candidatus Paceibacterota bacterium]
MNFSLGLIKNKSPKKIFFGVLILFCAIFLPFYFCFAIDVDLGGVIAAIFALPVKLFLVIIDFLLLIPGLFISLGTYLGSVFLGWVTGPDFFGGKFTGGPIVEAGLSVIQPLANVLILIAILVIAISTIMRVESYGMRRLLIPLIVVALLINFVPTLMGFIVDGANFLMHFFTDKFAGGFLSSIAAPMGEYWANVAAQAKDSMRFIDREWHEVFISMLAPILQQIMVLIFNFCLMIVLFAFCLIFIARYFVLWILTILSPLAVASYILPFTKKLGFNKWMDLFIDWTIIGITAGFFIWLSFTAMGQMEDLIDPSQLNINTDELGVSGTDVSQTFVELLDPTNESSPLKSILPYFIGSIFMMIAFITTLSVNSKITSTIKGGWGQLKGQIMGATKLAGGVGAATFKTVAPKRYERMQEGIRKAADWGEKTMGKLPVIRDTKTRERLAQISQVKNNVEKEKKRAESFASTSLAQDILREVASPASTAKLLVLAERGDIGDLYKEQTQKEQEKILKERGVGRLEDLSEQEQGEVKTEAESRAKKIVNEKLQGRLRIAGDAGKLSEIRRKAPHLALVYQTDSEKTPDEALEKTMRKISINDIKDMDAVSFEGEDGEKVIEAALKLWGKERFLTIAKEKKEIQEKIDAYALEHLDVIGDQLRTSEAIKDLKSEGWKFASQITPQTPEGGSGSQPSAIEQAEAERDQRLEQAEAERDQRLEQAEAERDQRLEQAEAERDQRLEQAEAEIEQRSKQATPLPPIPPTGEESEKQPPTSPTGEETPPTGEESEKQPPTSPTGEETPPTGEESEKQPPTPTSEDEDIITPAGAISTSQRPRKKKRKKKKK